MAISDVLRNLQAREAQEAARQQKIKLIRALLLDKGDAPTLVEHFLELHCQKQVGHRRPSIEVPNVSLELWFGPRMDEAEPVVVRFQDGYRVTKHSIGEYLIASPDMQRSLTVRKEREQWRMSFPRGFNDAGRAQARTRSRGVTTVGMRH